MQIYLVRHGETGGNVARRHQADTTGLTDKGIEQVRAVSERLKQYEPTHIITSTLVRAVETASYIGTVCDIIPETNAVFAEIGRPNTLHGHFHSSLRSLWFYMRWYFGLTDEEKEGGESYKALRERIAAAQQVLEQYPPDARIVVVSHSAFINFFVSHLCYKGTLSPIRVAFCFFAILTIPNASVIPVKFDHQLPKYTCRWRIDK